MSKRVILVTDGDAIAKKAVDKAVQNLNLRYISASAGNPTPLDAEEIVSLIDEAESETVVLMVDDCGDSGIGAGEKIINKLVSDDRVDVIGAVAVASNTEDNNGCRVNYSIDASGSVIYGPVDKMGKEVFAPKIKGDTLGVIDSLNIPMVVGIGDPGKMEGNDGAKIGSPVLTKAIDHILQKQNELVH